MVSPVIGYDGYVSYVDVLTERDDER